MATLESLGWRNKVTLTLNTTSLGNLGSASGFPIPVIIASGDLDEMFTGDHPIESDAGSLRILDSGDTDESDILNLQVEKIDVANKDLVFWFKASSDINNTSQQYDIYWGNSSASQPAAGATGGYEGVWTAYNLAVPMNDDPDVSGQVRDYTGNGYNGTKSNYAFGTNPSEQDGILGYCQFDETRGYIGYGDKLIDSATAITIGMWAKHDVLNVDQTLVAKGNNAVDQPIYLFRDEVGSISGRTDTYTCNVSDGVNNTKIEGASNACNDNNWHHVVMTFTASSATGLRLYIDGVEDANSPGNVSSIAALRNIANPMEQFIYSGGGNQMQGYLDDFRISLDVKTSAWIRFEYEIAKNQGTYISFGVRMGVGNSCATVSMTRLISITSGYKIKAQARLIVDGGARTKANACRLLIKRIPR